MKEFSKKVLEIIKMNNGIKATEIAKILDCERSEVNSVLYTASELKNLCWQDSKYLWYSNEIKKENISGNSDLNAFDEKLNDICKYYLNCLSVEQNTGIYTFLSSKFAPLYIEVDGINKEDLYTEEVSNYLLKHNRMKKSANFLGYPILIDKFTSKKGEVFYRQYPIFLFNLNYDAGYIELDSLPAINVEVIKKYSTNGIQDIIYEQLQLEEELGLNGENVDVPIDEMVARLQSIRLWDWKEEMDPNNIDRTTSMEEITETGIYNRAIVVSTEKSPYTIGLESELLELSKKSKEDYMGTALYEWIHGVSDNVNECHSDILEVLPLNIEQYQAVDMALNQDLTIVTGPPGTGKSQVVTDILVNMASHGKSALFTSKNNKAVDVVYNRINGLVNKPVMLRVGGNAYASELANLIENILTTVVDENTIEEYKCYKDKYNEIINRRKDLIEEKEKIVRTRNNVDKLEQKICKIDEKIRGQFNKISDEYIWNFTQKHNQYKIAYTNANKNLQDFITKILWKWKREEREEELEEISKELNEILKDFNICVDDHVEEMRDYSSNNKRIEKIIDEIKEVLKYKKELSLLNRKISLEDLDSKIREEEIKLKDIALKVWEGWILTRNSDINAYDRTRMASYVSAMKLIGDRDINEFPDLQKKFKELQGCMTKYLPCWSVTSLSVKGRIPFTKGLFDLLIIDEASQCDIASILPLLYRAKRVAVIGDQKQLSHISAISKSQDISMIQKYNIDFKWAYSTASLYDLASGLVNSKRIIHLRDHHRSFGDIIEFSNREFYEGKLRIATNYSKLKVASGMDLGIRWIDVVGEVEKPVSGSACNIKEAQKVVDELQRLMDNNYVGSIGVVTPFRAQAEKIRDLVVKNLELYNKLNSSNNEIFLVDTVHKFQGDERDIILFSPVISKNTSNGAITFLNKTGNLFNVAITRARSNLIVVGDKNFCSECAVKYMSNFVKYYENIENFKENTIIEYNECREYPYVENKEQVSEWEKIFYTALFDNGIKTIPQFSEDKYKLDLAIIIGESKLDIEIDGEMYHKDWNGELCYRDQLRNQRLYELGWDVKRFWVYQIRDELNTCIDQIKEWVKKHEI